VLPSSKINEDVSISYNSCGNLKPIRLNDLSVISPIKKELLNIRNKNKNITIQRCLKKMALIIPYRNREEHLKEFIPAMKKHLDNQNIDYEIIIVEQSHDNVFNRAKLLNIGVLNSSDDREYFVFHDVDFIPANIDYRYCNHTVKPFKYVTDEDKGGYREYGETILGGVTMIPKTIFLDINGYSNEYWQWGKEDDDLLFRQLFKGYVPLYDTEGTFDLLPHPPSLTRAIDGEYVSDKNVLQENKNLYKNNKKLFSKFKRGLSNQNDSGLNNISDYEITSIIEEDNIKTIKVKL